jgi:hypothetical protein
VGDVDGRLMEIAENLHRAELSVAERADQIAEWVRLTTDQEPAQVGPVSGGRGNTGGIRAASRELGITRQEGQRAIRIASIAPEAREAARAAGLDDNQSALLKVASAPTEKQVEAVEKIVKAKAEPKREGRSTAAAIETPETINREIILSAARDTSELCETLISIVDEDAIRSAQIMKELIDATAGAISSWKKLSLSLKDSAGIIEIGETPESLFESIRPRLERMSAEDVRAFSTMLTDFMIGRPTAVAA